MTRKDMQQLVTALEAYFRREQTFEPVDAALMFHQIGLVREHLHRTERDGQYALTLITEQEFVDAAQHLTDLATALRRKDAQLAAAISALNA